MELGCIRVRAWLSGSSADTFRSGTSGRCERFSVMRLVVSPLVKAWMGVGGGKGSGGDAAGWNGLGFVCGWGCVVCGLVGGSVGRLGTFFNLDMTCA